MAVVQEAVALREKGNRYLRDGDFTEALKTYFASVAKADEGSSVPNFVMGMSNAAEVYYRLGSYHKAALFAKFALQRDPQHIKSLFRHAKALEAIGLHESAAEVLEYALELSPDHPGLRTALQRSRMFIEQQKGKYNLSDFLLSCGISGEQVPDLTDYVGPVEIRMTQDGKGRGMFVTKDVEAGDLLLVSTPLACAHETNHSLSDFKRNVIQLQSQRRIEQLRALDNKQQEDVPMELFQPKLEPNLNLDHDQQWLKKVFNENSARISPRPDLLGFWLLPSFINHSCLPNASRIIYGTSVFIIAAVPISAGQEVLITYFDSRSPLNPDRREALQKAGFDCNCKRCALEKRLQKALESVSRTYAVVAKRQLEGLMTDQQVSESRFRRIVSELEVLISSLGEEEQAWIRAAYVVAYLCDPERRLSYKDLAEAVRLASTCDINMLVDILKESDENPQVWKIVKAGAIGKFGRCSDEAIQTVIAKLRTMDVV